MNSVKILSLIILSTFISTLSTQAQTQKDLEKNKDVVWAGEVFTDYTPRRGEHAGCDTRMSYKDDFLTIKGKSSFKWLKMQIVDINKTGRSEQDIVNKMFFNNDRKYKAYKTHELKETYTNKEISSMIASIDTIVTFDPETFEKVKQVMVRAMNPKDIKIFRLKQTIYYDYAKQQFMTVPIAIAPMLEKRNDKGESEGMSPLFWVEVGSLTETPNLNDPNITWAKRMYRNCQFEEVETFKKDKSKAEIIEGMGTHFRKNAKTVELASTFDADGNIMMKEKEKEAFGATIDTIITFHPTTFEENVSVVQNRLNGKDIDEIRLLQDWIWNEKEQKLYIRHAGFALIIKRYDDAGNFLNSGPMFIRRVDFK